MKEGFLEGVFGIEISLQRRVAGTRSQQRVRETQHWSSEALAVHLSAPLPGPQRPPSSCAAASESALQ